MAEVIGDLEIKRNINVDGKANIGTGSSEASAILDVSSTTQGVLPPRLTTAQRVAITSPAKGLFVFDITLNKHAEFNGSVWVIYEPSLGNPTSDGQLLASSVAGARSWVNGSGSPDNFSYSKVPVGTTVTIPLNQQMILYREVDVQGTLVVNGSLVVLDHL